MVSVTGFEPLLLGSRAERPTTVLLWCTQILKVKSRIKLTIEKKYCLMQAPQMSNKKIANASVSSQTFCCCSQANKI